MVDSLNTALPADVSTYQNLITDEHADKSKFVAAVLASVQGLADVQAVARSIPIDYDLDNAVGVMLDVIGQWVGRNRYLSAPLPIYFTLGGDGSLGFGRGVWRGPFDPVNGLVALDDESYRRLLRSVIVGNTWNSTIPAAYTAFTKLFANTGFDILIQNYNNGEAGLALIGQRPDAITLALFTNGEIDVQSAGIVLWRFVPTVYPAGPGGTPLFGFGADNAAIGGFGRGAWVKSYGPPPPPSHPFFGFGRQDASVSGFGYGYWLHDV